MQLDGVGGGEEWRVREEVGEREGEGGGRL